MGTDILARTWLRTTLRKGTRPEPDDVTVVIGVRDRADHRLALALRCLRDQTYPAEQIEVFVIDYGSASAAADRTLTICRDHDAAYLRVEARDVWSRSRCLNIGIRRATTKYVVTSDADLLLSPRFLEEAVAALRRAPLSVICAPMLDLPEHSTDLLFAFAGTSDPLPLDEWRTWATPRHGWRYHRSLTVTHAAFHQLIRGYDEFYEDWGHEDLDLWRRFMRLGLKRNVLDPHRAFYLHQWHRRFEDTSVDQRQAIERNRERFRRVHTIVRNDASWGCGGEYLESRPEPSAIEQNSEPARSPSERTGSPHNTGAR